MQSIYHLFIAPLYFRPFIITEKSVCICSSCLRNWWVRTSFLLMKGTAIVWTMRVWSNKCKDRPIHHRPELVSPNTLCVWWYACVQEERARGGRLRQCKAVIMSLIMFSWTWTHPRIFLFFVLFTSINRVCVQVFVLCIKFVWKLIWFNSIQFYFYSP